MGLINMSMYKLTVSSIRFVLLRSTDQNGCRARSVTEIIFEAGSTARELVATPTAISAIAEADVVGSRQAVSTRGGNACRSAIVYAAGTSAEIVNFLGTVCNHCVQCIAFGKIREVADRFTMESNIGVGGGEPVFELFNAHQISLPGRQSEQ